MKATINRLMGSLVTNKITWKILKPFSRAGTHMEFLRNHIQNKNNLSKAVDFNSLFNTKEVMHGPFKGMRYPSLQAAGSTVYPKLLGCYEKELEDLTETFCNTPYTEILDIGCAEGYYAVGLALRNKEAKLYAYDIDEQARELCSGMAKLNGVDSRVFIKSACSAEDLENFPFTGRGLIICDCEGYETSLFTQKNIAHLKNCELLIETHDFIDITISGKMRALFSKTHNITSLKSIDDIEKARAYIIPEIEHLDLHIKRQLVGEYRPTIMEWLYCQPKESLPGAFEKTND